MAPRPKPGFAWYIVCDAGFAVGLVSHYLPKWGHLVWMAEPVFDDEPTMEHVLAIRHWRWPVLFPLGAAVHRHIATRIGIVPTCTSPRVASDAKRIGVFGAANSLEWPCV